MDKIMAKCYMCLLGLIILCPFFKGTSGAEVTHVFSSSGESVRLPCNEALSGCTSTTWISTRQSGTDELVNLGKKKNDRERHETLSLGSDCSLNIEKVTQEDYGLYVCRQFVNGKQQGTDAAVFLHFLHVSSSSSHTDLRPGSVTLFCQLYSFNYPCDALVRTERIQLVWVNQAGVSVMTDSRYQISFSSRDCISTLTSTLLNEDLSRDLRCQVWKNELETSTTSNTYSAIVFSFVAAALAVVLVAVFWVIYKKRADNKSGTGSSVVNERKETIYETINMSISSTPNANEQTDDVTYSEVTSTSKKQAEKNNDHSNDTVTYAAVRGAEHAP